MWEDGYREVNRTLAAGLAQEWRGRPAPVLLQDYQLFGCGSMLRELVPHARIGLFCHSPFPGPSALRTLPHVIVVDILHGLLACDLVGFHTYRDLTGFGQACSQIMGTRVQDNEVTWGGRTVRLGVFPVTTTDPAGLRREATFIKAERAPFPDNDIVIVWVGPSDAARNPMAALRSFAGLLERDQSLIGRVRLLLNAVRTDGHPYDRQASVVEAATALNARFARDDWIPVALDLSEAPARRLAALERADVVLVTALMDAVDPVVEEAALLGRRAPALVLSVTSGVYERFADVAVPLDPRRPEAGTRALLEGLALPATERSRRLRSVRDRMEPHSAPRWLEAQLAALAGPGHPTCVLPLRTRPDGHEPLAAVSDSAKVIDS